MTSAALRQFSFVRLVLALPLLLLGCWAVLALWFHTPDSGILRFFLCGAMALLAILALVSLFRFGSRVWLWLFLALLAYEIFWFSSLRPAEKNWSPDVARQTRAEINSDILTLSDVRAFAWYSKAEGDQHWERRSYDLKTLKSLDLFMSHWSGENIAHMLLSFGFEDGRHLVWSYEVRRSNQEAYSPIGDAFNQDALVLIAADETDIIRLRTNFRREDVRLYRIKPDPVMMRRLIEEYALDANKLADRPIFYNSITSNCTTVVAKMLKVIGERVPFDYRIFLNGHFPDYVYDQGKLDTRLPFEKLTALSHIDAKAVAVTDLSTFSSAIRENVPNPALE